MDTTAPISEQRAAWLSRRTALIVASCLFMQGLDGTIIVTALPAMAQDFGVRPSDMSVGITAYMLTMAAVLPLTGWLSDRVGARNVFAVSVVIFTLASMLCGQADSLTTFTAARLMQGLGAGLMGSVGRLVVMRNTDNRNMLAAVALMVWPALAAPIIGPALGGVIVTQASWRWIFYVNVPIGLVGLGLILAYISRERSGERQRFDGIGFVLSSGAMVCLVAGLESIAHSKTLLLPGGLLAAGCVLGFIAYRRFGAMAHPLIPLDALKVQTFATASIWGGWTFRMTVMATPFVLPLMFQVAFGFSPVRSGLLLLGYFAGNLAMKPFTNAVLRRFGFRQTLIVNIVICTATIAGFAFFTAETPVWIILAMAAASGASRSMQFTCLDSLTYCEIPPSMRTGATTLWGVTNQLAAVMGVAFAAIVLNLSRTLRQGDALTALDFRVTIAGLAVLCIMALPAFLALPKDAGADVTGHRAYGRA